MGIFRENDDFCLEKKLITEVISVAQMMKNPFEFTWTLVRASYTLALNEINQV